MKNKQRNKPNWKACILWFLYLVRGMLKVEGYYSTKMISVQKRDAYIHQYSISCKYGHSMAWQYSWLHDAIITLSSAASISCQLMTYFNKIFKSEFVVPLITGFIINFCTKYPLKIPQVYGLTNNKIEVYCRFRDAEKCY